MGLAVWLRNLALAKLPLGPKAKTFLLSDAGPFTIFFWAPMCKWCIVLANISDLGIPAEHISAPQQTVLMMSGLIWSRYVFQIYPFSWNLLAVQVFMAGSAMYQLGRKAAHSFSTKK